MIDMEHGPYDIPNLIAQLQAIAKYDVTPLARAPWNDFVRIKQILDCGVMGLLVPYVNTKEEAQAAVRACKYPPEGIRGVAGSPRASGYGMDGMRYMKSKCWSSRRWRRRRRLKISNRSCRWRDLTASSSDRWT